MAANKDRLEAKSADYNAMIDHWGMAHDFTEGENAVIKSGEKYLPKFPKEETPDYKYRLGLAKFTNVYGDILDSLVAKPFEQEIQLMKPETPPQQLADFIEDVDGSGSNMSVFAAETFYNGINYAMDFILVDYVARNDGAIRTVAEEKALGLRPYWIHVLAANVYEIKSRVVNGKEQISYVRIFEPSTGGTPAQFREMYNDGAGARYEIWKWSDEASDYVLLDGDAGPITIGFIPLCPIITGTRKGKAWQAKPALKGAIDLQKKLYQAESNLEHIKTMTAFPMLSANGVSRPIDKAGNAVPVSVGPSTVLFAPSSADGNPTSFNYIEPAGSSLTFLKEDIKETKQDLRELGKQPLTISTGTMTVINSASAAAKAKSAVKKWGIALTDCLTLALYYTTLWQGAAIDDVSVKVYDQYDDLIDNGNDVSSLLSLSGQGKLSLETTWKELQRRRILSADFSPDDEKERLLNEVPNVEPPVSSNNRF